MSLSFDLFLLANCGCHKVTSNLYFFAHLSPLLDNLFAVLEGLDSHHPLIPK